MITLSLKGTNNYLIVYNERRRRKIRSVILKKLSYLYLKSDRRPTWMSIETNSVSQSRMTNTVF